MRFARAEHWTGHPFWSMNSDFQEGRAVPTEAAHWAVSPAFEAADDLRALTNAIPALVSYFDAGQVCRYANDYHRHWYGRTPEELVGLHIRDFIGPEQYAARQPYLARVAQGELVTFDAPVPYLDGGLRAAAVSYVPRMIGGSFQGFYTLVFDVARRKQELADMLNLAHDAIFVRDLNHRTTFWNTGSAQTYGYQTDAVMGKPIDDLLATRFAEPFDAIHGTLIATGQWQGELVRRKASGEELIVAARWVLRRDEHGQPIEILETGRDVTARRRAEAELHKSEYRYRNVFRAMAVSFWELDFSALSTMLRAMKASGVKDFRAHFAANPEVIREMLDCSVVVDVNEKSVQLFGGTRDQIVGSVSPYWPVESEGVFAGSVLASIERKPHFEAQTRFSRLDGSQFDAYFTCCFPRDEVSGGNILVGILDISDRVKAHDDLVRAQNELAHAARIATLGEISASIAHEVNQPLAAIVTSGHAGLRWLGRAEPNLEETRASINSMIADARRASDIVTRIRAMSTKKPPEQTVCNCAGLVRDALAIVSRQIADHGVRLVVDVPGGLPDVRVDRIQLQQVIINLAVNAVQAMVQSGSPKRELTVRGRADVEGALISVTDTGPGVDPDHQDKLFNAFYTTKAEGMGMGLSICKSIVEAHGGKIAVGGAQPHGAVFTFTLPSADT
jgi:PAS domain S-box-containing protein